MIALGFLMFIGFLFAASLFSINAAYGDKEAANIRDVSIAFTCVGAFLILIGVFQLSKVPFYEYKINAHYIDGQTKTLTIKSRSEPKIKAKRGTYWLGAEGCFELGVVRFEIISKKKIEKIP